MKGRGKILELTERKREKEKREEGKREGDRYRVTKKN